MASTLTPESLRTAFEVLGELLQADWLMVEDYRHIRDTRRLLGELIAGGGDYINRKDA